MLLPILAVSGIVFLSTIFNAIALFTRGWAYFSVPSSGYSNNDFSIGLVPFDSSAFGWFVTASLFMYLSFTLALICSLMCIVGILISFAHRCGKYQAIVFMSIGICALLSALAAAITFIIFVANYQDVDYDYDYGGALLSASIGFSPFIALLSVILFVFGTGVCMFFAIAAMNRDDEEYE